MFGLFKERPLTEAEKEQKTLERSNRVLHPDKNPCIKEQDMAYKCLSDNDYDRDRCSKHFQNYRNCKDFWTKVTKERRRQGMKPYMPQEDDREKYIKQYQQMFYQK